MSSPYARRRRINSADMMAARIANLTDVQAHHRTLIEDLDRSITDLWDECAGIERRIQLLEKQKSKN